MRKKLLPIFMLLLFFTQLWAQTGKLVGVVTDQRTGDPLIGVNVLIEGTVMGASTDGDGYYVIVGIRPGTYTLNVSYIGYKPVTIQKIQVKSDLTTTINAEMQEAQLEMEEAIVVVAERPIIQKDLTSSKAITTEEEIELLPVDNVVEIVNLTPGFVDGHARGGRDGEVVYKIDGVDAQDPLTGGYDTEIPEFALQEISVETGGLGAEHGNAQSGVVSMAIAEGGNEYSGRLRYTTSDYDFIQDKWSDHQHERTLEFSISGPELLSHLFTKQRDKLRFMFSGNIDRTDGRVEGNWDKDYSLVGKLTYRFNDNNKFSITGTLSEGNSGNWGAQWKKSIVDTNDVDGDGEIDVYNMWDALPKFRNESNLLVLTWMKTLSKDSYFEMKFSRYHTYLKYDVDESMYGGINYTDYNRNFILDHTEDLPEDQQVSWFDVAVGNEQVGGYYVPGNGNTFNRSRWGIDEKDIYSAQMYFFDQITKNHQLKAGIGGKYYDIYDFDIDLASGGNYYTTNINTYPIYLEAYAEDKMEYGDFIMRVGMRFDYFKSDGIIPRNLADPVDEELNRKNTREVKSKRVISPRIGISHPISTNDVIYFNYGKYTQIPNMRFLYANQDWKFEGAFPIMGNPDIGFEENVAYEIGLKHSFNRNTKIEIKGFFKDVVGLVDTKGYYLSAGQQYSIYSNEDYGTTRGVEFTLRKIGGRWWDGQLNYTYIFASGKSSSPTQNYSFGWANSIIPNKENPLDWDQRHTVTATLNGRIPYDANLFGTAIFNNIMASFLFDYGSGLPYSPSSRTRQPNINTERFPWTSTTDVRFQKLFAISDKYDIKIFMRVNNLFDKKNINANQADIDFFHNDLDGDGKRDERAEGKYNNIYAYNAGRRILAGIQFGF